MSQARITLRPPPNVEFIRGYPGIPAGHDRPHAEVTGTIELRLGASGVKAKWVQVELRKVETLPGGGQANTFYDYIGPSPVKVWGSNEEFALLQTQDFPFSIRIPESVPPSIALEKNAGIKYELVAKVCMKGKKGIFRKAANPTLSTMTPIVIDKHELHSTWPVYSQPDSRHVVEDRLTLTVDRTHTCYGPGDRISVNVMFRNDAITVIDLRSFEFALKETVIFRAGPHAVNRKGGPQVKVTAIGEQRIPMNRTVYGGQHHRAELSCVVPQSHNTTTVNAARHIDITYSLVVKAVLGSGKPLLMELPVTISNWPRHMSMEAVRRIGPSAGLSLLPPNAAMSVQRIQNGPGMPRPDVPEGNYNTMPGRPTQVPNGGARPYSIAERVGSQGVPADTVTSTQGYTSAANLGARKPFDEFGQPVGMDVQRPAPATYAGHNRQASFDTGPSGGMAELRRPRPLDTAPVKRLTLVNADMEPDSPPTQTPRKYMTAAEEKRELQNASNKANSSRPKLDSLTNGSALPSQTEVKPAQPSPPRKSQWPSAEEEKARLYNKARTDAVQTQAGLGNYSYVQKLQQEDSEAPEVAAPTPKRVETPRLFSPPPEPEPAPIPAMLSSSPKKQNHWPTAEEEKLRLFNNAQNTAMRTQAMAAAQIPPQQYSMATSGGSGSTSSPYYASPPADAQTPISPGAALYSHAMAAVKRNNSTQASQPQTSYDRPTSPPYQPPTRQESTLPSPPKSRFPTAEEEKAALRYYEAKRAVDRHQNVGHHKSSSMPSNEGGSDDPIAYDALYPSQSSSSQNNAMHNPYDAYETQGAGGSGSMNNGPSDIPAYQLPPPSPPPVAGGSSMFSSAMAEKEKLRRRYEMEDAAANAGSSSTPGPSSSSSPPGYGGSPPSAGRSQPLPPVNPSASRQLSAAEEKARLKAQYEAEDAASRQNEAGGSSSIPAYTPPPAGFPYMGGRSSAQPNGVYRATSLTYASNNSPKNSGFTAPPPPPPLAPRPPADYIEETEQEDARSQAEEHVMTTLDSMIPSSSAGGRESKVDFGLSFRPFSPLDLGIGVGQGNGHQQMPAPPLPPKVPVFD
ncbi:hypothetical protein SCHPADRAFT_844897 [Schizopora paradoxa]|uniref:Arrestin C-terminal-like domain-containing protein n=1 Tax=Schizopora paradoxa TaxID=27342 RepID=A0A0H2S3K7_9AGAM|nr:hypothetical protein SCHPADRAFT_844897 [Schizopora paradoxa]